MSTADSMNESLNRTARQFHNQMDISVGLAQQIAKDSPEVLERIAQARRALDLARRRRPVRAETALTQPRQRAPLPGM